MAFEGVDVSILSINIIDVLGSILNNLDINLPNIFFKKI
jgi:hypothetical protein